MTNEPRIAPSTAKIVLTGHLHSDSEAILGKEGNVVVLQQYPEDLEGHMDLQVLVVRLPYQVVNSDILGMLPALRIIARQGAGCDSIDLTEATRKGICVTNTPEANSVSVAEHTWSLILALTKRVTAQERAFRVGDWGIRDTLRGVEIDGKILGVVGFGRIGRRVAAIGRNFGMKVLVHEAVTDGAMKSMVEKVEGELVSLETLLSSSHVITLHVPLISDTSHMISTDAIGLMRRDSYVINTARGELVDTEALIEALQSGRIAGAAMDVYESEPPPLHSSLLKMENVVLTPHTAALTNEAVRRMGVDAALEVARFLHGERPRWIVNPDYSEFTID